LFVGILTLLLSGYSLWASFEAMSKTAIEIVHNPPRAYSSPEFEERHRQLENDYTADYYGSMIFGGFLLLAILLLVGAAKLSRADRWGLVLHWIYIPLQILLSIALAIDYMWLIANAFPFGFGGIIFYIGAIPGLIGCLYPVSLLPLLLWGARRPR